MRAILSGMDTLFEAENRGPPTREPDPGRVQRETTARWRRACARRRSPTSSARRTSWAPDSALRTAIEQGHPHSMILYGPPGTGKTTLARILAEHSDAAFEELSAVQAGRAEVRAVLERAAHRRDDGATGERGQTVLLPRRDPPLQQGPAGRTAAGGRGRPRHVDRSDHREPRVRGQRRAALAHARVCAAGVERRGDRRGAAARAGAGRRATPSRRRARSSSSPRAAAATRARR